MNERMTEQKKIIYDYLKNHGKPITAIDLHEQVIEVLPNLAISTVYRILQSGVNTNKLIRTTDSEGEFLFSFHDKNSQPLIICSECHELYPITGFPIKRIYSFLTKTTGFLLSDLSIQFNGICPECQNKHKAKLKGD